MKIYYFNAETRELLGEGFLQEGENLPGLATELEPPIMEEDEIAIFDWLSKNWKIEKDFRGQIIWQDFQSSRVIEQIGDIPEGWSLEKPDKPLDVLKEEAKEQVNNWRDYQYANGIFEADLPDAGKHKFQYSMRAKTDILGIFIASQKVLQNNISWTNAENNDLKLTAKDVEVLSECFINFTQTIHDKSREMKEAIDSKRSVKTIDELLVGMEVGSW